MIYQVDKIVREVRVCMGENISSTSLLSAADAETLSLDTIIKSKIVEAVERVHKVAPYWLLEQGHNLEDAEGVALYWGDMNSGWIRLPGDFMRLVVFEMDDWERPVYKAISVDSPEYAKQRSRHAGIRGTAERPVCAIEVRPYGRVLAFYSCKSHLARVRRGVYIPYPRIELVEVSGTYVKSVDISERCYTAVVYTVAGLTLATQGEAEQSKAMLAMAEGMLN